MASLRLAICAVNPNNPTNDVYYHPNQRSDGNIDHAKYYG